MKLSQREKILAGVTVAVVVFAVFKYGYLNFSKKHIALGARLSDARNQITVQSAILAKLAQDRAPSSTGVSEANLRQYIDENTEFTMLIQELTKNAQSKDLHVVRLAADKSEKHGFHQECKKDVSSLKTQRAQCADFARTVCYCRIHCNHCADNGAN
jgi:7-cyano-7-deazaguanine synthase in queuosine biosynthesis